MKTLPPQRLSPADYESVRKQISSLFYTSVFKPVLDLVGEYNAQLKDAHLELKTLQNSAVATPLMIALRLGMIQYKDGVFSGNFSHATSANLRRLGATFNKHAGTFYLSDAAVPEGIKHEARVYQLNVVKIHQKIVDKLTDMQAHLNDVEFEVDGADALFRVKEGFEKSAKALEVMPKLSEGAWEILREEYTVNLGLYIRRFTEESIIDLREATQENALIGYRFDRLAAHIMDQYKTSAAKAEFLAKTETSIFMSNFRKQMFTDAGVRRYIWRTTGKMTVRDDHAKLNGRIFFYNQPPIADQATGIRANPGGIWNCECVDEPILEPLRVGDLVEA